MTTKSEMIHARMMPDIKHGAEAIFSALGLSATDAITLFYKQVILNEGIPFEIKIPNKLTKKIVREIRERKGLKPTTLEDLKREFPGA